MRNAIDNIEGIEEIETFNDKLKIEYKKIENILQACKISWGETYKELSKFEIEK